MLIFFSCLNELVVFEVYLSFKSYIIIELFKISLYYFCFM